MENIKIKEKIFIICAQYPLNPNGGAKVLRDKFKILSEYYDLFMIARDKNPEDINNIDFLKWIYVIKKTKPHCFFILLYRYFVLSIFLTYRIVVKEKIKIIQLESFDDLIYSVLLSPLRFLNVKFYYTAHDIQCLYYKKKTIKFIFTKLIEKIYLKFFINYVFVWGLDDFKELVSWGCISENKIKIIHPILLMEETETWQLNKDMNFVFMGSINHVPNRDSINYILKYLWPEIKKLSPKSLLYLILGSDKNGIEINDKNIVNCGFVENPKNIFKKCNLFLAPIISGTGIKIKIIESFNFGIPLISTPIGFRNFDHLDYNNILIAETKEDFIKKIKNIIINKESLFGVSNYEKKYFKDNFYKTNVEFYKKYYSL